MSFTTRRRCVSEKLVERGGCDSISASVAYELHKPPLSFRTPLSLLAIILTKSGVAFHRSRLTRGRRGGQSRWTGRQRGARWPHLGPFGGGQSRGFRASRRKPSRPRSPHPCSRRGCSRRSGGYRLGGEVRWRLASSTSCRRTHQRRC